MSLITELVGLNPRQLSHVWNRYTLCAKLVGEGIDPMFRAAAKPPTVETILELFIFADIFCASVIGTMVDEILKLDAVKAAARVALALRKEKSLPVLQAVADKLIVPCVELVTTRLSEPFGSVGNWALSATVSTEIGPSATIINILLGCLANRVIASSWLSILTTKFCQR